MGHNKYIELKRIEYSITNACTSNCIHCSAAGSRAGKKQAIEKDAAVNVIKELAPIYQIGSVMTFGGEPLLYPETVCAIHKKAMDSGIPARQVITNGSFTKDRKKTAAVAKELKNSGVNSLLLSVDVFHRQYLPLEEVFIFAEAAKNENIECFKLQPAWVVNIGHDNMYNTATKECLEYFAGLEIPVNQGNNIFPAGNAELYLSEFYEKKPFDINTRCGEMPYTSRLDEVDCISIEPGGDVVVCCFVIGNIYKDSIMDILKRYDPYKEPAMSALINGGVKELIKYAEAQGITADEAQHYSACGICRELAGKLNSISNTVS